MDISLDKAFEVAFWGSFIAWFNSGLGVFKVGKYTVLMTLDVGFRERCGLKLVFFVHIVHTVFTPFNMYERPSLVWRDSRMYGIVKFCE